MPGCCLAWGDGCSIADMSDSIFLLGDDGWLTEAHSSAYQAEAELQELLDVAVFAAGAGTVCK